MPPFFKSQIEPAGSAKKISADQKPYLIAEIGLNHNSDNDLTKRMIEAAAKSGADAVKFQSYTATLFVDPQNQKAAGLYNIFASLELSLEQHLLFQKEAKNCGLDFFSTPLTADWVERLDQIDTAMFKIASGDLRNEELLMAVTSFKRPLIISTGNSTKEEINRTRAFLEYRNFPNAAFLHCISAYPTPPHHTNLQSIEYLKSFALAGFSDHSAGVEAPFAAAAMGASIIEKHFTLDTALEGPDHAISSNPQTFAEVRKKIDLAHEMRGEARETPFEPEKGSDFFGKRSLYYLQAGRGSQRGSLDGGGEESGSVPGGGWRAMRPRLQGEPLDSDYLELLHRENHKENYKAPPKIL